MRDSHDLAAWETVPDRVARLLPEAARLKLAHIVAAEKANILANSFATWQPAEKIVNIYYCGELSKQARDTYRQHLAEHTCTFEPMRTPDWDAEILIKRAIFSRIGNAVGHAVSQLPSPQTAFDYTQKALGGPTPLSNAIVTSLIAGGLGYGAGTIAENLFPERYLERGKLRRTLGLLGAAGGIGFGAMNANTNARHFGVPFSRGWTIPNDIIERTAARQQKKADFGENPAVPGNSGLFAPSIPIQQFNNAVWNDARKGFYNGFQTHTPPAYAAATTGLMTGLGTGLQSPIIRPADVINGIASAGVGLATATSAGKALSALAGLTPMAQEKLQDMGLWGGVMHAIVPSMLGLR